MRDTILHWLKSDWTPLYLAPQAGVSESPFRRLCRRFGADVVVSEFVSAEAICRGSERTFEYLRFDEDERPIGVQIFGAEPHRMAEAARYVADTFEPDFIDINFGCPVKKVVKRNGGSGCLRDLGLVSEIVAAVRGATELLTTVKVRSGFNEKTRQPARIGEVCEAAGAEVITLHPRTRADMYSGEARWSEIRELKEAVSIPVIGNGDIRSGEDAARMRDETGCDGIMIARGSHGDPWLFQQARAALDGKPVPPDPTVAERFQICMEHARNAQEFEPDSERAIIEFRKHLGWYTKGLPSGRDLRQELFQVETLDDIQERLQAYLDRYLEGTLPGMESRPLPDEARLAASAG
ncbi:MAG: tRNA dihydrouridine synthase DusB [Gemmatimonadales bacterium]|nr:MAG: tRNA dihydrouridine synthase DusB [Gemmatimonadales bacterium]